MRWFLLLPCWLIFNILALCVNWVLPAFATHQFGPINNSSGYAFEPRLPKWLNWFMTYDNSLLGDGGFRETHDGGYWSQVAWLYRNSAYGFERSALAAMVTPYDAFDVYGDPFISDKPHGKEGFCLVNIGDYWSFDWIFRFTKTKCMKIGIGWKLKTYAEDPARVATQPVAQYNVSPRLKTTFKKTEP